MNRILLLLLVLSLGLGIPQVATPLTVDFSSGTLAAQAVFEASATNLIVTLTNTSAYDVLAPTDVLTAVFFDIAGPPHINRGLCCSCRW